MNEDVKGDCATLEAPHGPGLSAQEPPPRNIVQTDDFDSLINAMITVRLLEFHAALVERGQISQIPDGGPHLEVEVVKKPLPNAIFVGT